MKTRMTKKQATVSELLNVSLIYKITKIKSIIPKRMQEI